MVLQRTIENLRERPRHERQAVAFWIALAVVVVLAIGWGTFFVRAVNIPDMQPVNDAYNQAVQQASAAQAQMPTPPDDTGWVSTAAPETPSDPSQNIQIIQEDGTTGTTDNSQ